MAPAATSAMATFTSTRMSTQLTASQRWCMHLKRLCALRFRNARIPKWSSSRKILKRVCILRAQGVESAAAGASADSTVAHVAELKEAGVESKASTTNAQGRRPSPLTGGGTLTGDKAAGKDPGLMALGKVSTGVGSNCGAFQDVRWKAGNWDLLQFTARNGKIDWDAVIDAEVLRRKWLEDNPEASLNEDPIVFNTSTIPWWAWMQRFHLPEAELLNGRAAMIGFIMGYVVDALTGAGLVDQTSTLIGKLLLFASVLGVLFIRKNEDVDNLKQLAREWTMYDKQWRASWQDEQAPSLKTKD